MLVSLLIWTITSCPFLIIWEVLLTNAHDVYDAHILCFLF